MKTKLTQDEKDVLLPHIKGVLNGDDKRWEDKNLHHPAGAIIDAITKIKGVEKKESEDDCGQDGFDTNGWQYDWWQRFSYKGKDYTLSGSGYYGGHSFGPSDE